MNSHKAFYLCNLRLLQTRQNYGIQCTSNNITEVHIRASLSGQITKNASNKLKLIQFAYCQPSERNKCIANRIHIKQTTFLSLLDISLKRPISLDYNIVVNEIATDVFIIIIFKSAENLTSMCLKQYYLVLKF